MVDNTTFKEVARSVTVSYPIPFLTAVLLAFTLSCFGLAIFTDGWRGVVLAILGVSAFVAAITCAIYALFKRPELLRHEKIDLMHRALEIMGSAEISAEARRDVGATVVGFLEGQTTHKPRSPKRDNSGSDSQ